MTRHHETIAQTIREGEEMREHAVVGIKPGLESQPLLELALDVLAPGGTIHLVSLVAVGTDDDELERVETVKSQVESIAEPLREQGYAVRSTVQVSTVGLGTDLARVAENAGADLLVIGLAKRSRVGKALLGSDAQTVMMHATCPVLASRLA